MTPGRTLPRAFVLAVLVAMCAAPAVQAQAPAGTAPPPPASKPPLTSAELETLVGPVALYPDDLVGIVLPASTTPLDVVKAQRFLDQRKSNPNLQPDPKLPEPVRSLLNYPEVLKQMSDNLDWTGKLGEAVVSQQRDVMAAVQAFRRKVQSVGNLKSDEKQIIVQEKEVIKIVQADPQVIYVPQYQPSVVVVQQAAPPVQYYPTAYPVYYYPYPPGAAFATGLFVGATTAYAVGWVNHSIYQERYENHSQQIEHYQQNRMDYATQSREDWQSNSSQQQTQRQEAVQGQQTQRQEAVQGQQTQRQEQISGAQAKPPPATRPQPQPSQTQAQRPQGGTPPQSGQAWHPQTQTVSGQASAQARPGDSQFGGASPSQSGGQGGAFGGVGSASSVSQESQRGSQSRTTGSASSGAAGGGGRSGGGRRR
jgi:hypothetical protein